ncbi:MAG: GNAT family N-acetyltransferase [Xanthomonadaceae bacterium]|jgi:aminoglycoside 6'-N-acetyltransferase I|nr:GNAT family N-acetyltransferase [Xanthomonadaceae bacterium]
MIVIESSVLFDQPRWLELRRSLWPTAERATLLAEMKEQLAHPERYAPFLAYAIADDGRRSAIGFAEASLRYEYVNGARHLQAPDIPAAFLEGLYVVPTHRHAGVARQLVRAVIRWARSHGCHELLSDVMLENISGQKVHEALGFEETERVVFFRQDIQ